MSEGVFVAGTDTGVGKTVVTAGLTAWHRATGREAVAVKPCQTGAPCDEDAAVVAAACGTSVASRCLRRLEPPLAPRVAAERVDRELSYEAILADVREALAAAEYGVVEGIGGLRVPLAGDREVLDLAADLGLPTLVVARSGLGTLNHTALSVGALRARGLSVRGVLLNEYAAEGVAERTNPDELERMLSVPVWTVPPLSEDDPETYGPAVRSALPSRALDLAEAD